MEFKDKIKTLRTNAGLTMEELARAVGVSAPTIQRYESGEIKNVRHDKIKLLADALRTTPAYLMDWAEAPQPPKAPLSGRDERDISRRLEQTLDDLEKQQGALMFDGEPLDDQTKELLKASLENSIRIAKINAKKFTNKRFLKSDEG